MMARKEGETTNRELAVKLMDLQRKWQKGCKIAEGVARDCRQGTIL